MNPQDQNDLVCGYQLQDKAWVFDPNELPWGYGTNEMPEPTNSTPTP